jgi:7-cyano-7-deazaguanine synthase
MILVLFSGGVDSCVLANMALQKNQRMAILHISYKHPAAQAEIDAVVKWCIDNNRADLFRIFKTADLEAQELEIGSGVKGPRIVPSRNSVFVSIAANVAAAHNFTEIWIGATASDFAYPDCSPEWIKAQNELLKAWNIELKAPLINLDRTQILQIAKAENWDLSDCWSCYQPLEGAQCGACNSCMQK